MLIGSSPVNNRRAFEIKSGWELNEDDERKASIESQITSLPTNSIRASPEGCDSELSDNHIDKTAQQLLHTAAVAVKSTNNNHMNTSASFSCSIPELHVTYVDEEEGGSCQGLKDVKLFAEPIIEADSMDEEKTCISVV